MKYNKKLTKRNNRFLKELRNRPTKAELIVKNYLENKGAKYIFQKGFFMPFHRIVDFYIPKKKIIIEIDGGVHNTSIWKDKNKDLEFLFKRGMKTIRIKNEQVYSGEYTSLLFW